MTTFSGKKLRKLHGMAGRQTTQEVVLVPRLRAALQRLNQNLSEEAIEPLRMANRMGEVQDKVNEMRKPRFEVEEDVRRRRLQPLNPRLVVEYVNDLEKFLESNNIFERRVFLATFIESLEVDDGGDYF